MAINLNPNIKKGITPPLRLNDLVECPRCRFVMNLLEMQVRYLPGDQVIACCPNCGEYL